MAITSSVEITPGSGAFVATYDIVEDEETKKIQRLTINNSSGTELGTADDPLPVTLGTLIGGEDIVNNILGITKKPVVSGVYSATPGIAPYNDVDILVGSVPIQLFAVACNNKNAAERFLWLKNKATVISGGDTVTAGQDIVLPLALSTSNQIVYGESFFGQGGMYFPLGLTIGVSTSATSFTAATTTDHMIAYLKIS